MTGILIFVGVVLVLAILMLGAAAHKRKWVPISPDPHTYASISDQYYYLRDKGIRCKLEQPREVVMTPNQAISGSNAAIHPHDTDVEPSEQMMNQDDILKVHKDDLGKAHQLIEEFQTLGAHSFRL